MVEEFAIREWRFLCAGWIYGIEEILMLNLSREVNLATSFWDAAY